MTKVILKKGRDESVRRFHPWIFSGAIAQVNGRAEDGDVVAVYDSQGNFLAYGHWQNASIAVRILSFDSDVNDPAFWEVMLSRAYDLRRAAGLTDSAVTNCYRLVHGEGDGLPGLVVDYYDGVCVLQAHSTGMFRSRRAVADALVKLYGCGLKAVYDKSSGTAPHRQGQEIIDGYLWKAEGFDSDELCVLENGHRFNVCWTEGQKTGFFLDQRENRAAVKRYSGGRNVLNLFCYTGGFSIYALAGGAIHCDSVDSSHKAVDMLNRNVALNGFGDSLHTAVCADAIDFLHDIPEDKYDLIVLDPPAFAKRRSALGNALRAYQRLNAAAISKLAAGGLLFSFSCSQAVDKEQFALALFSAATQCGRSVRILDRFNQPCDHAVSIYHPEGEYLKGLLLYVE